LVRTIGSAFILKMVNKEIFGRNHNQIG